MADVVSSPGSRDLSWFSAFLHPGSAGVPSPFPRGNSAVRTAVRWGRRRLFVLSQTESEIYASSQFLETCWMRFSGETAESPSGTWQRKLLPSKNLERPVVVGRSIGVLGSKFPKMLPGQLGEEMSGCNCPRQGSWKVGPSSLSCFGIETGTSGSSLPASPPR